MKPLLPSLKERKRYVVFHVMSDLAVDGSQTFAAIHESMQEMYGQYGLAQAGMQFIAEKWNMGKQRGMIRINHDQTDKLKASLVFINTINNSYVTIHSVGTSGILGKAHKKYIGGELT